MDPALIRPGRIDMKEYIGFCSVNQLEEMFKRFFNSPDNIENAKEFASKVIASGKNVSPAQVQGYFMMHKTSDAATIIANVDEMWSGSARGLPQKVKAIETN